MKKLILSIITVFAVTFATAQIDLDLFDNMKPRNIGPAGMSGRVTSIDAVNANPEIIYIGTASGGVWKSESGGIKWKPVFEDQPTQNIGAVAIQQSNPDVIWAGTGEGNPRNSQSSGGGIFKSLDAGKTWTMMGLEKTITIHRIIINKDNPDIVHVAAMGSAWGPNPERGLYRTTDGGSTWEKILYINEQTGCADLIVDPTNANKMIAGMWEYGRKPWFFTSGGEGSGMYITVDGGKKWTKLGEKNGLPKGEMGRVGLAIAASNPKVVYALVESKKTGLYKSTDGGYHWKLVSTKNIGNRPFYYADIYVDPKNENRIYNLWSMVSRSEDGGKTFKNLITYANGHPDHHAFWIHPDNPNLIMEGNDGGLNISRDRGEHWRFIENLPLAQFYHINYDMEIPYNVYGGMQDNGSWIGPAYAYKSGGIRNDMWEELLFGDGFDVVPCAADSRYGYAMYQGGNVYRYDLETGKSAFIQPIHPDGTEMRFNWNAAVAQDPHNPNAVYFGSQFVHHSTDRGDSWKVLSPDLTTNDTAKQHQAESGGLTIDATRAENFTTITVITPSPTEKDVIWVGTDDGNVQLTKDGGENWTNLASSLKELPAGSWICQIEVSPTVKGQAYVVANNYRRNDWKPYVYKTTDYGKKWVRVASESNVEGHAHSIVEDPVTPNLVFMGTERGLYFSIDGASTWTKWDKGYPSVSTIDLKIHPREHDLIIGTFGRAAWILDNILPLRKLAMEGKTILDKQLVAFDIPDAHMASWKSAAGSHFPADAEFKGRNRGSSAQITFWLNESLFTKKAPADREKESTSDKDKKDKPTKGGKKHGKKVKFTVLSMDGDTIRRFSMKADTGYNKVIWGLDQDGFRYPSFNDPKPDANRPGGARVKPGKYQIHITYKGYKDSTEVMVHENKKAPYAENVYNAKAAKRKELEQMVKAAKDGFDRMKEAQKTIKATNARLEYAEDKALKDSVMNLGKTCTDSIKALQALYRTPKDFEGYDHVTVRLNDLLYAASSYINSADGVPGATTDIALKAAEDRLKMVLKRINDFFEKEWKAYRAAAEGVETPMFKDYTPIQIDGQ